MESALAIAEPRTRDNSIRKLVEQTRTFDQSSVGADVSVFFRDHPTAEGVVVLDGDAPCGLIMRNDFYQKLGTLFGREIFMRRPIMLIMNPRPLIVDVSVDIATISLIAMNREQEQLYDMVVVTEEERYLGVVSIKRFMIELSRNKEKEIDLLKQQQDILRMANEAEKSHRRQIEEKNVELRDKNDAVRNLLDNAGQGFLSVGSDMVVSEDCSLECVQIFRGPVGGRPFIEVIGRHVAPEVLETMASVFASLFSSRKALQQKVYLSLLPGELSVYGQSVRVEHKLIRHLDQPRVMLILTNITEKKTLELKMAEERSNLKLVVKALARKADVGLAMEEFRDFMAAGARDVVASAAAPGAALAELFRLVHTCKGDFAQLGFHRTAGRLHGLEDALAALAPEEATRDGLAELVRGWDAEEFLREDKATLANVLGKAFFERDETFPVSREELVRLASMAERLPEGGERDELLAHLRTMQRHSVRDLLREHEEYVAALAERLEKHIEPLAVTGDDVLVDKRDYRAFLKSLVHVFRNMVDHGIEAVEQRVEADKPELGRIACHVERLERDGFAVTLSDDGRGIDRDLVLRKAVEKGVIDGRAAAGMTGDEVFGLLFLDSFSTRDNVSALSGRGVGLAAVKAETEALGGRVEVGSEPGRGSRFRFVLPAL